MPNAGGTTSLPVNAGQNPSDWVDKLIAARREETALKSLNPNTGGETLAASIVNKALDVNLETNKNLQEQVNKRETDINEARREADKAKTELYSVIAGQVAGALDKLEKVQDEIRRGPEKGQTKSLVDQVKEARDLLLALTPEPKTGPPPVTSSNDLQLTITLETMKQNHEVNMKKLDLELQKMQTDLQLKLAEIADAAKWKEREYSEGSEFKKNALTQVTDVASAAVAAFNARNAGAGGAITGQPGQQQMTGQDTPPGKGVTAVVRSFNCQKCGTEIVVPEDGSEVKCPTPGCGVKYGFKETE
jgi:DNA-directed RNA polymerase subunit RPC12/RpoP/predicted Holliday junction resolvase-like endonuclease